MYGKVPGFFNLVIDLTLVATLVVSHPAQSQPLAFASLPSFSPSTVPVLSMSLPIQLASTEPQLFQGALVSQA